MFGTTRPAYDSAGSTGFRGSTNYRSVPDEVLADPATALRWAEDSVDATRRVKKR
jgi:TfoX/Sxy family transcriptional regulator of competence genes